MRNTLRILMVGAILASALPALGAEQSPAPPVFKNLQVFPKDIGFEQLVAEMQTFEKGLGKDCDYCHVVTGAIGAGTKTTLPTGFDFALDDKPAKRITRQMMTMVRAVNVMTLAAVGKPAGGGVQMQCFNCHRGMVTPPEPLRDILDRTTAKDGLPAAIAQYRELRGKYYGSAAFDFSDPAMGEGAGSGTPGLQGYATQLFFADKADDALAWLNVNLEYHPKSVATLSMKAFLQALVKRDKVGAIETFSMAIAIDPQNAQLREQLKAVEALP
jgi:hypothetical protein